MLKKLLNPLAAIIILYLIPMTGFSQQNALDFDNVDDQITVANASAAIANSTNISLSLWVYPTNTNITFPDYDGFAGFRNNTTADFYMVQHIATSVEARFRNSAGTAFDVIFSNLSINTWQHLVLIYNGSTLTLYKNGLSVGSVAASGTITSTTETFYMGNLIYQGTNFFLKGKLDEVSLWNKALTSQEVTCIYNNHIDPSDPNLKLYYKFNQGVANGNNSGVATLQNTVTGYPGTMLAFAKTGTSSNFVPGVIKGTVDSASICPGETLSFGTLNITQSGNYIQAFQTASVCDSIVELKVTVASINLSVGQTSTVLTSAQAGGTYQWIDCNNGNAPVANAIQQSFAPPSSGSYAVIITLGASCSDTSNCISFTTGIDEWNTIDAAVYPNPFHNEVSVKLMNAAKAEITVSDIAGRIIYLTQSDQQQNISISSADWKAGSYLLKVKTDAGMLRKKLVKEQ
jgi:hypothetical protein